MARGQIRFDDHRIKAGVEDVNFLLANGVKLADACERVGLNVETYEMRMRRAKAAEDD